MSDRTSPGAAPRDRKDPGLAALVRERGAPLLEALEEHLPGARAHAEATGTLAFEAARRLGLHPAVGELHRQTARLHDIGMLYVPRTAARTPYDQLDAAGRAAFDAHYEAGAKLALGAGIPDDVCDWLLRIRERFDGAGGGAAGRDIPIAARIIRAACAADLLIASAQDAVGVAERRAQAAARLRHGAGAELDPAPANALADFLASD